MISISISISISANKRERCTTQTNRDPSQAPPLKHNSKRLTWRPDKPTRREIRLGFLV